MKKCPFCAEEIQDEAIVCRYCGRELEAELPPEDRKKCPHCAEWIRTEAIICRFCGRDLKGLDEDVMEITIQEEPKEDYPKSEIISDEAKDVEKPLSVLSSALKIGVVLGILGALKPILDYLDAYARAAPSGIINPTWERMQFNNIISHLVVGILGWSIISAIGLFLWRRAKNVFWGLLVLALMFLGWFLLEPDIDIASVQLPGVSDVIQEAQPTSTQYIKSTPKPYSWAPEGAISYGAVSDHVGETLWVCGEVLEVFFGITDINTEPRLILSFSSHLPSKGLYAINAVTWMDLKIDPWRVNLYEGKTACVYGKISMGKTGSLSHTYLIRVTDNNRVILR